MKLTARQYAKTLFEVLQDTAAKDHDTVLDNFSQTLAQNGHLKMFDDIALEYEKLEKESRGVKIANVTSASPLTPATEKEIVSKLNELVNGKVELRKQIDEKILGGVVIRLDDQLIDASVKHSLEELKKDLSQ